MLKKEFMCVCECEWVSVLIVICTWHSRTPNADHPPIRLCRSFSTVVWCPSFREKKNNYVHTYVCSIYMYVCIVIFYSWMFTIYTTYEWLYTYIHTCICTYLVNYTYVCMYVGCECWLIVQCMHMYHIYIPFYIFICVFVWGISHRKKCICMNALK